MYRTDHEPVYKLLWSKGKRTVQGLQLPRRSRNLAFYVNDEKSKGTNYIEDILFNNQFR